MLELNYFAVGAGTVIMTVLGALWYGPLFTKPWLVAMGKSMEEIQAQGGMAGAYALSFAGALVASFVLALVISGSGVDTIIGGALTGALLCLGFVATSSLGGVLFEGRAVTLYLLSNGYHLVGYAIVGALLAVWR